jgi:hypothetical protein
MPFERFNNGDVNVLTLWSTPMTPGVLTTAEVLCELPTIQHAECLAYLYLTKLDPSTQYSFIALASGLLTMMTPVKWQGQINVDEDMRLCLQLRGHQVAWFRINWSRTTTHNIREIGELERAIKQ